MHFKYATISSLTEFMYNEAIVLTLHWPIFNKTLIQRQ